LEGLTDFFDIKFAFEHFYGYFLLEFPVRSGGEINHAHSAETDFFNNSASDDGGGVYAGGNLTVDNSTISGNTSGQIGGAIYDNHPGDDTVITLTNSTIVNNSAATAAVLKIEIL
jgi:predicted outer membrane repeat protein